MIDVRAIMDLTRELIAELRLLRTSVDQNTVVTGALRNELKSLETSAVAVAALDSIPPPADSQQS